MLYVERCLAAALLLGTVLVFPQCATPRSAEGMPVLRGSVSTEISAQKEVAEMREEIDAGDSSAVIPRLLQTISKYPGTEGGLEARYLLGEAYYKVGGYRDAIEVFQEYLRLAPKGEFAPQATEKIASLTQEYQQKFPSAEELDAHIQDLTAKVQAQPDSLEDRLALADMLWKRGDYAKAAQEYKSIVTANPAFAQDTVVASRVEFQPNGEYTVLSPAEIARRQKEAQPIAIINTTGFRSGEDLFTREKRFYSVSGQAINQSDSVLYGVEVMVTLYGFGNMVFDTTTVSLGRLNPSETRAFSVRFSNFDNIENISRYEAVASFQK